MSELAGLVVFFAAAFVWAAVRRDPKPLPPPPTPMPSPMPVPYGHPRETAAGMQSDRR